MPILKQPPRIISLITDFGINDEYVGVMKGAILKHCSTVQIIDITHAIPPQNILYAARIIASSYPYFPEETIHVVVVDPGVGTDRSIILAEAANHLFIAPDNGVLTPVLTSDKLQRCYCFEKSPKLAVSNTFHGRDIMAPLAGKVAAGMDIAEAGPEIVASKCKHIELPRSKVGADRVEGEVIGIDHFGNIATSITAMDIAQYGTDIRVSIGNVAILGLSIAYGEASEGELLALIDSRGCLEIAKSCSNAAVTLQCKLGDRVTVQRDHLLE